MLVTLNLGISAVWVYIFVSDLFVYVFIYWIAVDVVKNDPDMQDLWRSRGAVLDRNAPGEVRREDFRPVTDRTDQN